MSASIEAWLSQAREKLAQGAALAAQDLDALDTLLQGQQQHLLYIWSAEDRVEAHIISWNYFGPFDSQYRFDPKNECPYPNVKTAMADGWRVISFPAIEYPLDNAHNQLGFQFVLERYYTPGQGLAHTPHGKRQ